MRIAHSVPTTPMRTAAEAMRPPTIPASISFDIPSSTPVERSCRCVAVAARRQERDPWQDRREVPTERHDKLDLVGALPVNRELVKEIEDNPLYPAPLRVGP